MKTNAILLLLLSNSLCAQSNEMPNLSSLSLEELLGVQFSEVSRKEQSNLNAPLAIYTLTSEQIQRSGATNIPEALRLVPGVHVGRISGSQYAISIRSPNTLLSDQMLVMVDGREVFNRLFNGTYWDSIDTMLEDIDRIEVIRGPGGSLWGSNAGNGIINIVTKKSSRTTGTLLSTQIGSGQDHARVSGRIGFENEMSSTRLYVTGKDIDQSTYEKTGQNGYDALHFQQVGFRHDIQLDSSAELSLHGDLYQGKSELAKATPDNVNLSGGNIVSLYRPNSDIRLQAYYDYTSRKRDATSSTYRNYDVDYQQTAFFENQTLLFGGGVRYTKHDYTHTNTPFAIAVDPSQRDDIIYRAFIQDEIQWNSFSIIPGIKYEYNEYVASQWQPSLRVALSPTDNNTLWISASRSVATPSRIESDGYLTNPFGSNISIAATPLKPAIQNVYEAGYKIHPYESLFVDVATYYNNYQTTNPKSIDKMYGTELNIVYQPNKNLTTELSYTYTQGETNSNIMINNLYEHMFNAHINYNLFEKLQTDAYYYYYSHTATTDPINRVDVHIGYQYSPVLLLEFIGQNLFNSDHIEANQDPTITLNTDIEPSLLVKATLSF